MSDLIRLVSLIFLILMALFASWIGLRSWGLSHPISDYKTPFVSNLKSPDTTLPLVWEKNGQNRLIRAHFEKEWIQSESGEPLKNVLEEQSTERLLLFIDVKSSLALPALRTLFAKTDWPEKTVFCGRADGTLKDLRELEPEWTFCSGEIYMTRFLALHSIGLASLLNISADIFFIHLNELKADEELLDLISEAHRQHKPVFMGPVSRPLKGFEIEGWMVESGDQKAGQ